MVEDHFPALFAETYPLPAAAPPDEQIYGDRLLPGAQATGGSTAIRAAWRARSPTPPAWRLGERR
jgi:hypothetical protein